jgi:hypothetical protein
MLNWARLHSSEPDAVFILKSLEAQVRKKAEVRRWKLIADALLAMEKYMK